MQPGGDGRRGDTEQDGGDRSSRPGDAPRRGARPVRPTDTPWRGARPVRPGWLPRWGIRHGTGPAPGRCQTPWPGRTAIAAPTIGEPAFSNPATGKPAFDAPATRDPAFNAPATGNSAFHAPASPHHQQHACHKQTDNRRRDRPPLRGAQHQCRSRPGGECGWDESKVRRSFLTGVGGTESAAGRGVDGSAGGREVGCTHIVGHGRTRFRRSAKRRSPMPLTSRSSSTERKPPCWVR